MDAAAALAWMGASRNSRPSCLCDVEWLAECYGSVCGPGTRPLPQYAQFGKRDVTIFPPEGAVEKLVNSLQPASSSLRYTAVTRCFFVFFFYIKCAAYPISVITDPSEMPLASEIAKSLKQLVLRRTSLWCSLSLCVYG